MIEIYYQETNIIDVLQGECVINHGKAILRTGNLVNCICIGGTFRKQKESDIEHTSFLIHEAPQNLDKIVLLLEKVTKYYYDQFYTLVNIVIFRKNKELVKDDVQLPYFIKGIISNYEDVVNNIVYHCDNFFGIEPEIINYFCDITKSVYGQVKYNYLIKEITFYRPSFFTGHNEYTISTELSKINIIS